jgi:hypothetical protein
MAGALDADKSSLRKWPIASSRGTQSPQCGKLRLELKAIGINELADVPRQDQFGIPLQGNVSVGVPDHLGIVLERPLVAFLLLHESPNFVTSYFRSGHVSDSLRQDPFAVLAGQLQQVEHGSLFHVAQTGRSAHAVAFHEAMEDSAHGFPWEPHISAEGPVLGFLKAFAALLAFETLDAALVAASFDGLNLATMAGHLDLDLSSGRVQNGSGSYIPSSGFGLRLTLPVVRSYRQSETESSWWPRLDSEQRPPFVGQALYPLSCGATKNHFFPSVLSIRSASRPRLRRAYRRSAPPFHL